MSSVPLRRRLDGRVDLLRLHSLQPHRYPVLLESSANALDVSARSNARWDYLFLFEGEGIETSHAGKTTGLDGTEMEGGFLASLESILHAEHVSRLEEDSDVPPFKGGFCVFLGYELTQEIEPTVIMPSAPMAGVRASALRARAALAYDHSTDTTWLVAEHDCPQLLGAMAADIAALDATAAEAVVWPACDIQEARADEFTDGVNRILEYLAAGDVFQVNLSRAWDVSFERPISAAELHASLRDANPAPFSAIYVRPEWAVVSASPERLVQVHGEKVEARPIAGTRPRLADDPDAMRVRELVGHPKERAEHVMLVDLIRNDIGRVSRGGSVEVNQLMTVESFAHVHHIVSNVRGIRRPDTSPVDVIRAVFPGGTITGCPKVRCMQIIAELEGEGRGAYTGSLGWINRDGDMDLNILIRSAEIDIGNGKLRFRTGAGIVMDSDPGKELDETRAKARGMLKALTRS